MNDNKARRYYWIKLFDSMLDSDLYNHIMSLDNGATIFTIYIAMLMSVINKKGKFVTVINSIEIVDTVDKIKKELKHFKYEQVLFTLGFLETFGVLSKDENGAYFFPNYDKLVGSETASAIRQRKSRENRKLLENKRDNVTQSVTQKRDNVTYRDKDIKTLRHKENKTYREEDIKTHNTTTEESVCECAEFISLFQKYSFPEIQESLYVNLIEDLHKTYSPEDIKLAIEEVLESYQGQRLSNPFRWLKSAVTNKVKEVVNRPTDNYQTPISLRGRRIIKPSEPVEPVDDLDDPIWDMLKEM